MGGVERASDESSRRGRGGGREYSGERIDSGLR